MECNNFFLFTGLCTFCSFFTFVQQFKSKVQLVLTELKLFRPHFTYPAQTNMRTVSVCTMGPIHTTLLILFFHNLPVDV